MIKKKVIFSQLNEDGSIDAESVWCIRSDKGYIVDNIPFIAKRVSLGDTIQVEYDETDKQYYFENFLEVSGNSTIRIYFKIPDLIEGTRADLLEFGCESEAFLERNLVAVNIPEAINYNPIKHFLEIGEQQDKWTYEESCLAHEY